MNVKNLATGAQQQVNFDDLVHFNW
ncbi:hypothetical protein LWM68_34940 [Niabella sp. W65]|nr:hypothetical protein [Niabella sp. W65]MCH7367501.1 hypothetical protein [Niabella sp. W65]